MNANILILVLFVSICGTSQAATNQKITYIDSLNNELKQAGKDTNRVNIYYNLGNAYKLSSFTKSISYAHKALELSKEINWSRGEGMSYILMCSIYRDESFNYHKALYFALRAQDIFIKLNDKKGLSSVYSNIGNIYFQKKSYKKALGYYQKNVQICRQLNDKRKLGVAYSNIGACYDNIQEYQKALTYMYRSLNIATETGNLVNKAVNLNNISLIYSKLGEYKKALNFQHQTLNIDRQNGVNEYIAIDFINLADIYLTMIKNSAYETGTIKGTKNDFIRQGLHFSDSAKSYLNFSKDFSLASTFYKQLSEFDSIRGDYNAALAHFKLHKSFEERYNSPAQNERFAKIALQYDYDKKEALNSALRKQEKSRLNYIIFSLIIAFVAALIIVWIVLRQRNIISREKKVSDTERHRSEELLLNILPQEIASELKEKGSVSPKAYTMVTVMLTDFKGFTSISELVSAELLVNEIHHCFSAFDQIIQKYKIEKIKTIGDAYLCVSGLPTSSFTHATDMVAAAVEMRDFIEKRKAEKTALGEIPFEIRIGIHTGPLVAGIVGIKKYVFDIWGDTVNMAARMEQHSLPGKINISERTYELVKQQFNCEHRGKVEAKNKGLLDMYFVE